MISRTYGAVRVTSTPVKNRASRCVCDALVSTAQTHRDHLSVLRRHQALPPRFPPSWVLSRYKWQGSTALRRSPQAMRSNCPRRPSVCPPQPEPHTRPRYRSQRSSTRFRARLHLPVAGDVRLLRQMEEGRWQRGTAADHAVRALDPHAARVSSTERLPPVLQA